MAGRIEAIVKPELLIWARKSIGLNLSDAARKIGIKPEKLDLWEKGEIKPTINQLRKASNVYKRPLAVFYLPEPPKTFDALRDFRKIAEVRKIANSPSLLLEIRRTQYKREIALDISKELGEAIPVFKEKASISDNTDVLAQRIRDLISIPIERQFEWKNSYIAFNEWINSIENLGILIFQTDHTSHIELNEMRGFAISKKEFPVIVLNAKDTPNGKIFTLLHEFTHLILHNGGVCDLEDYRRPVTDIQKVEVFCNQVAGSVLVPKDNLIKDRIVIEKRDEKIWMENELVSLASRFSVSREVILRRLLILNRTTEKFYKKKREEYLQLYKTQEKRKMEGFPPYYRLKMRNNGHSFIKIVLNAYNQELITSSQVSDYLGIKLKHLNKIENEIMRMAL